MDDIFNAASQAAAIREVRYATRMAASANLTVEDVKAIVDQAYDGYLREAMRFSFTNLNDEEVNK